MANPYRLDFAPINNVLTNFREQAFKDRQFGEGQRQFDLQNKLAERRLSQDASQFGASHSLRQSEAERAARQWQMSHELDQRRLSMADEAARDKRMSDFRTNAAGVAQLILGDADPASASAKWQRLIESDPRWRAALTQYGIDPSDYQSGARFLIAEARGYQEPSGLAARTGQAAELGLQPGTPEHTMFMAHGKIPDKYFDQHNKPRTNEEVAVQAAGGLRNLLDMVDKYDDASFESALGPLQGAETSSLLKAPLVGTARILGEVGNMVRGGKSAPSEVRSDIKGATEALAAAIKPLIRGPGEGAWTDADQARLVSVVGDLAEARNKAEFRRRLNAVRDRLNNTFGMSIDFDALAPRTSGGGKGGRSGARTGGGSAPIRVQTPDEARRLPRGTRILLPDGTEGIVP